MAADWRGEEIEPVDIAILMTKTPDSGAALAALHHLRATVDTAVSWQNGLAKDTVLAEWCGADRVLGGASMVGAVSVAPGVVRHTFTGPTFIGEFSSRTSTRSTRLRSLLEQGGLPAIEAEDIASVEWSKVIQVLPAMALTALTRMRYHEVLTSEELARVFARLVREAAEVAAADGVTIADWPGMLPIKTLADLPEDDAVSRIRSFGQALVDNGQTHIKPSMLQSIERGGRLEVEEIHGHVVEASRRLNVPAPTITLCYELLRGIDRSMTPTG
jgi:2-dehydropantoate 2-reductase